MTKNIFIGRLKAVPDHRDSVLYTRIPEFECGHYFGSLHLVGPNFWILFGSNYGERDITHQDLETDLSQEEYDRLVEITHELCELGFNICRGDERFTKGHKLIEEIKSILMPHQKLREEGKSAVYNQVRASEKKYMAKQHNLKLSQVKEIIDNAPIEGYWDKGIISRIYQDYEEIGESWIEGTDVPKRLLPYIDYERLGRDIASNNDFFVLSDGQIVEYAQ